MTCEAPPFALIIALKLQEVFLILYTLESLAPPERRKRISLLSDLELFDDILKCDGMTK